MKWKPRLKIYQGSNRKNTFDPETFEGRSYRHWLYVTKIKGQVVFNDYSYSVTTNGHQSEMKSFLSTEMGIKNMILVNQHESLSQGIFLDSNYEKLALAEVRLKAKNRRTDFYTTQKDIIAKCKKDIATLKKLGAKSKIKLKDYRRDAKESEAQRLVSQREASKIARDKRKAIVGEFQSKYESTDAIEV